MNPLLIVTNPRAIPECMEAFAALDVDVAYVRGMRLADAMVACNEVIAAAEGWSHVLICADDCVVTQSAVDAVLDLLQQGHPVVTGWCNLDRTNERVNLSSTPLRDPTPAERSYNFPKFHKVADYPEAAYPTHFVGMSLTAMSREMWLRYPLGCYQNAAGKGWSSDYHLSLRLQTAGVPMVAARDGWVDHVKEVWQMADLAPEKRLLVGEVPPEIVLGSERLAEAVRAQYRSRGIEPAPAEPDMPPERIAALVDSLTRERANYVAAGKKTRVAAVDAELGRMGRLASAPIVRGER